MLYPHDETTDILAAGHREWKSCPNCLDGRIIRRLGHSAHLEDCPSCGGEGAVLLLGKSYGAEEVAA